jgi:AcrR family transcriptional regulator
MPTTRHDSAATRARLVRAAEELYSTLGFLRTTTPMLAERAGIAEGTIYRHFKGKEQLLDEVCRQSYDWATDLLLSLESDRVRRVPERLAHFAQSLVAEAARNPSRARLLIREDHLNSLGKESLEHRRGLHASLSHLIATGKADGLVRTGPAELWASVWYVVVRHVVEQVATGAWEPNSPSIPLVIDAAWNAIAARGSG